jgi:hypothetical protein
MKIYIILLFALYSTLAHAAPELSTYYCKQQKTATESRARYDYRITETKELLPGHNDAQRSATVETLRIVGPNITLVDSFKALAVYSDVLYTVQNDRGFLFFLFLDEGGPATIVMRDSSGAEYKKQYDCLVEMVENH